MSAGGLSIVVLWAGALVFCVVLVAVLPALVRVRWPYAPKPLLTKPERLVFGRLRQAFPELVVLAQVALSQAVTIQAGGKARRRWFGMVAAKSLDFVLCRPDFSIVAAVELDDSTHDTPLQRRRDREKDRVLAAAGIPLLRWRVGRVPAVAELRHQVLHAAEPYAAAAFAETH